MEKLEYFNQMHIRAKFEGVDTLGAWCGMLLQHLPQELHERIKTFDEEKMLKIKELMRVRIHFYRDMVNHAYFFTEPVYQTAIADKFLEKIKQSNKSKTVILRDLASSFSFLKSFDSRSISQSCALYLKEKGTAEGFKNEDIYSLLRFAITGNPVGAPVGDICEIIGQEATVKRLAAAELFLLS